MAYYGQNPPMSGPPPPPAPMGQFLITVICLLINDEISDDDDDEIISGICVGYPPPGYQGAPPPQPQTFVTQAPPAQKQGSGAATGAMAGWYLLS